MKKNITSNKTAIFFIVISLSLMMMITALTSSTTTVFSVQHKEGDKQKFTAQLSGEQEVPPVQTSASGMAWFKPKQDNISFKVNVTDIQAVTMAHIHSGKQGENGPPVVTLYNSDTPTQQMSGVLAKGNITADMLQGPIAGKQISVLVTAMQNGDTYVNVHTEQNPNGEIRGQIMMSNSTTMMK